MAISSENRCDASAYSGQLLEKIATSLTAARGVKVTYINCGYWLSLKTLGDIWSYLASVFAEISPAFQRWAKSDNEDIESI